MAVIAVVQQLEKKTQGKKSIPWRLLRSENRRENEKKPNYFYKISREDEDDKPM